MTNALLDQAHAVEEDQTKAPEGNFTNEPHPAGPTLGRLCGYVELGKRQQSYNGKEKTPAVEAFAYFELLGPKHVREIEVDGVTKKVCNVVRVRFAKKLGEKASQTKLLSKLAYGRDGIKNIASCLGEGFLINVVHNKVKKTVNGKEVETTYANIKDSDGTWLIGAPSVTDPLTNETTIFEVPVGIEPMKFFLWDNPTQLQWDSIFIDGTRTVKDDNGNDIEKSKNWLQEEIITGALDFEGSALQTMLGGLGELNMEPEQPKANVSDEQALVDGHAGSEQIEPEAAAEPEAATAPTTSAEDLLAQLGVS